MELLEYHFEIALETPDGIKKLRELILSLAMQGKLVPQDPKDQPASELLKEIEIEKKKLIKEGKIKNQEALPPIKDDEVPYALPRGWEWVRLNMIAIYNGRKNASPNEISSGTWVLDLEDIEKDTSKILNRITNAKRQSKSTKATFCRGDVLYGKLRPYLNKVVVADQDGVCTTEIVPIVPSVGVLPEYLKFLLKRPNFLSYVNELSYGVKMPRLGTTDAVKSVHPFPPLNEQKRIVEKIDNLMALCDKLEAERNERNKLRLTIHTATLDRLLTAHDTKAFNSSWSFITSHFNSLYSVIDNVTELKKAILQLAVMGKLVPQDPNDQPASELLKEIEAEKKKLIKEEKIKNQKTLSPLNESEIPYKIPKGWEWCQLHELGEINPKNSIDDDASAAFVPMPLIFAEYGKSHDFEERKWSDIKKGFTHFAEEDVVLAKITPCFENRKSCVMKNLPNGVGAGTTELHVYRNTYNKIYPEYVLVYLKSPRFIMEGIPKMTGSAGQKRVPKEYFSNSPFPLPPLNEQKRIVEKVNQLMELCNSLEQQIKDSTDKQSAIFDAVLAKLEVIT